MKTSILSIIIFVLALISSNELNAQKFPSLDKSPMDAASYPSSYRNSDKKIKIIYSRPQLKSRSLSKLAPANKIWRTGANEAAEITFYEELNFGGKKIKPGTYSLFSIPGENEWTIILSSAKNVWGSYFYKESEDIARVKAKVSESKNNIEAFSVTFDGEDDKFNMYLGWGNTIVTVPINK